MIMMMDYGQQNNTVHSVFAEDTRKPPDALMMRRKGSLIMKRAYYLTRRAMIRGNQMS